MAFVVFTGPPKEYFLSFNGKSTFALSKDLCDAIGRNVDIFIDKEKHLFGIKHGTAFKVYRNRQMVSMPSLAKFLGVRRKCRLQVKMSKKYDMFVGKCKMPFVDAWKD